jgi:hypothetical protein
MLRSATSFVALFWRFARTRAGAGPLSLPRGCGKRSALVVHHRDRRNRTNLLVTLCIRCHVRIHRSSGLKYWFSEVLVKLWRELHPNVPMQLQLSFQNVQKKNPSCAVSDDGARGWADSQRNDAVALIDLRWRTESPMG